MPVLKIFENCAIEQIRVLGDKGDVFAEGKLQIFDVVLVNEYLSLNGVK